jgi:hypothetical protein
MQLVIISYIVFSIKGKVNQDKRNNLEESLILVTLQMQSSLFY